tara:strand:- start:6697 stop:6990 length:294 start_codon:yes stop_codon:yes gene_type:complete
MFFLTFITILIFVKSSYQISCILGRAGCYASCTAQNCATGYCNDGTCVCSRCGEGPWVKGPTLSEKNNNVGNKGTKLAGNNHNPGNIGPGPKFSWEL